MKSTTRKHRRVRKTTEIGAEIKMACELLERVHINNAPDKITAITCESADILIVSSPVWRDRLARFVAAAFSPEHPMVIQLKDVIEKLNQFVEVMETDMTPAKQTSMAQLLRPMFQSMLDMIPPSNEPTPKPPTPRVQ